MKMKLAFVVICITLLSTLGHSDDTDKSNWIIKTAEQAQEVSLTSTGFSRLTGYRVDSSATKIVVLHNDRTPFLSINGRNLWETTVEVRLEMESADNNTGESRMLYDDKYREFKVYLDPKTGQGGLG